MTFTITIEGAPRTKKNSGRLVRGGRKQTGRQRLIPSKAFEEWNTSAQMQLAKWRSERRPDMAPVSFPIRREVNCCATIWREADTGDAVGYYQAIADALQEARIVENDRLVVSWDGSRLQKSKERPHVHILLTICD